MISPFFTASVAGPLFEKYTIDKSYAVRRINADGSETIIDSFEEKARLLDSDFFQGSIAFTEDDRHKSLMHKFIYVFQKIHAWFTGRRVTVSQMNTCHGMVILGKGQCNEKKPHPFLIAHSFTKGIQTSNNDYMIYGDVSRLFIYRPIDEKLRNLLKENAEKTAYVEKIERRTLLSPKKRHFPSPWNLVSSFFHNKKHEVCKKHGISERLKKRTASLVADCLLGNQPLSSNEIPQNFYCTSYSFTMLQESFFMRALDDVKEASKAFFLDSEGQEMKRSELIKKIFKAFEKEDSTDLISQRLFRVYSEYKIARMDTKFPMTSYAVKKLDKLSLL